MLTLNSQQLGGRFEDAIRFNCSEVTCISVHCFQNWHYSRSNDFTILNNEMLLTTMMMTKLLLPLMITIK